MLLGSHKIVFIVKEAAVLFVTMRDSAFAITKFIFFEALFKHILAWEIGISKKVVLGMKLLLSL